MTQQCIAGGGGYAVIYGVVISEDIQEALSHEKDIANRWYYGECAPALPCDTGVLSPSYTYSVRREDCYEVGGQVTVSAASGFATKLIAEVEGSVTFNGSLSDCVEITESDVIALTVPPCSNKHLRVWETIKTTTGVMDYADSAYVWWSDLCAFDDVRTYCNRRNIAGDAKSSKGISVRVQQSDCCSPLPDCCYLLCDP